MEMTGPTLCCPDREKTCFACCPPIRPQGYEHIQYRSSIRRFLQENRRAFLEKKDDVVPITGFSCWALGYLDEGYRRIGCMLHPAQNSGIDLRYRVHYGDKCRREICPEAKEFLKLNRETRKFWINLTYGLDSFSYSSRKVNPLFKLMGWGAKALHAIAQNEEGTIFTNNSFFGAYPFFLCDLKPRAFSYLLSWIVTEKGIDLLRTGPFRAKFEELVSFLFNELSRSIQDLPCDLDTPYTHLLDLDPDFLNFVRLGLGIPRININTASDLKKDVDRTLKNFI